MRYYRASGGRYVWLPYAPDELDNIEGAAEAAVLAGGGGVQSYDQRDYDVKYYIKLLNGSYLARLRKAFRADDFKRLFRENAQVGLYERGLARIHPRWSRWRGTECDRLEN